MKKNIILSICIATYNRRQYLQELIETLLTIKRNDIEIVVTDNASTDDTLQFLSEINDDRIVVYRNEKNIGGANNVIQSIYNAQGKYAFYCNDRDLIIVDKLYKLIDILYENEFSFIQTSNVKKSNKNRIYIYEAGYQSLINQAPANHPTGIIFNTDILHRSIDRSDLYVYQDLLYVWNFLMREIVMYEKSAKVDFGCWKERKREFKQTNISNFSNNNNYFFHPDMTKKNLCYVIRQITDLNNKVNFSNKQYQEIFMYILKYFHRRILGYKRLMFSEYETTHYGIKKRFITLPDMIKISNDYYNSSLEYLNDNNTQLRIVNKWRRYYLNLCIKVIISSIKYDIMFLLKI